MREGILCRRRYVVGNDTLRCPDAMFESRELSFTGQCVPINNATATTLTNGLADAQAQIEQCVGVACPRWVALCLWCVSVSLSVSVYLSVGLSV